MTHEALGLVGMDAGFVAVGQALLAGLGLVRGTRAMLLSLPLALIVGWAGSEIAVSIALMTGLDLSVALVVVLFGLLAGLGLALAQFLPTKPAKPLVGEPSRLGRGIAIVGGLVLAFALVELCRRALASGPFVNDVWAFWLPKAQTIAYFGGLDTHLGGFTSYPHADYPPLAPVTEATSFEFMGKVDVLMLPIQHWVLALGFLGGLASLLGSRVRPAILWPSLAMLALVPMFDDFVGSGLGEEPLTELFMLAVATAGLWLLDSEPRTAALCGLFLAATVLTKNEGLMMTVALLVMLVATGRPRQTYRTLASLVLASALAFASWQIWLSVNSVVVNDRDFRLEDVFHIDYLGDRVGRLQTTLGALPRTIFAPGNMLLSVPLALGAIGLLLLAGRSRRLALFGLGTIVLSYLAYVVIYWIGIPDIHVYLDSSAGRVMADVALIGAVLLPLLLSEALAGTGRE